MDDSLYNLSYPDEVVSLIKYTLTRATFVTKIFNSIRNIRHFIVQLMHTNYKILRLLK